MTISKGSAYGDPGASLPVDGVRCASDGDARRAVEAARATGRPFPVLGLVGGDLARTLGGTGALDVAFPVDLGQVLVDGRLHLFVATCVVRNRWWTRTVAVGNAQWLGTWNLWPKGHPNDGRLDVLDARLPVGDLRKVRARLGTGTHLPHPGIQARRVRAETLELDRPLGVWLDGERIGRGRTLAFRCVADALRVLV
ncbi:MAG: hypothetical protein ABIS47_02470 [Acidimicrobiales bacterium]